MILLISATTSGSDSLKKLSSRFSSRLFSSLSVSSEALLRRTTEASAMAPRTMAMAGRLASVEAFRAEPAVFGGGKMRPVSATADHAGPVGRMASMALREEITRVQPDIQLKQYIELGGETVEVDIPMTVTFFWPNTKK